MAKDFRHTSGALEDDYFYGRKDEIKLIHSNIDIRQHTAFIGQRQFGKTSLIIKAIEKYEKNVLFAHLDLTRKATLEESARVLLDTFMQKNFGIKKFLVKAKTDFSNIKDTILKGVKNIKKIKLGHFEMDIKETVDLSTVKDAKRSVEFFVSVVELIDNIASDHKIKAVIFIDEFQRLIDFPEIKSNSKDAMWSLRSVIQNTTNSTLLVAGSKPSVVKNIILDPDGAFLHSFIIENIYGVSKEDFLYHFNDVCKTYKAYENEQVTNFIYDVCNGIPSYLSLFGRKLFDDVRKKKELSQKMYFEALEKMFTEVKPALRLQEEKISDISNGLVVYKDIFHKVNPKERAIALSGTSAANIQNNTISKMEEVGNIVKVARGKYEVVDTVLAYYIDGITSQEQFEIIYKDLILEMLR